MIFPKVVKNLMNFKIAYLGPRLLYLYTAVVPCPFAAHGTFETKINYGGTLSIQ